MAGTLRPQPSRRRAGPPARSWPTCRRPPNGAGNPFAWGDRDRLFDLLGDAFKLRYEEGNCPQPGTSAEQVWELFTTAYGPTKAVADSLDAERRAALRREWIAYFDQFRNGAGVNQPGPYLLVLGTRKGQS